MPPTVKSEVRMRPPSLLGHKEATRRCSSPPKASLTPNKTWHTPVTTHNTADANTEGVLFQSPKGLWIHISSHVCRHWVSIQREKKSHSITNPVHAGMISHPILLWFWDGDSVRNPWPALHSELDLEDFVNNDLAPPFQADVTQ